MREPLRLAFLGCGFITQVHSRHLKGFRGDIACSYASRDRAKAERVLPPLRGRRAATRTTPPRSTIRASTRWSMAVPPRFHLDLTLRALAAGKHVLVEKPAFPRIDDYRAAS